MNSSSRCTRKVRSEASQDLERFYRAYSRRENPQGVQFLPPYSPELNPAERFFGELRKATANRIFATIEEQEAVIYEKLCALADDTEGMKRLLGYEWIRIQCGEVI